MAGRRRRHVWPPSLDMSTCLTQQSPPIAMPRTGDCGRNGSEAPLAIDVIHDRGIMLLIGAVGKSSAPGSTLASAAVGTL